MTHPFDHTDDQDWFQGDQKPWFNGKTDRPNVCDGVDTPIRVTPWAQGYMDGFQTGMYDNPFDVSAGDKEEWWCDYCLGFDYGREMKRKHFDVFS